MSKLNTKQRNALPDSSFCYVKGSGANKVRLFPVIDASDPMDAAALIGKSPDPEGTKACIIAKSTANGWKYPDAWKSGSATHAASDAGQLSTGVTFADTEVVIRTGKIFETGFYEDKDFDLTPEEAIAASLAFTPAPIDSGHPLDASPLDGKMGALQSFELGEDGKSLIGTTAIPKWLDDLIPPEDFKVSAKWNRQTKRLEALSLVTSPRIPDAALVAAFAARHDTPVGQSAIQQIHDTAAHHGAVCSQGNAVSMSSRHEMAALQEMHDKAVSHGASCAAGSNRGGMALYSAAAEPSPEPKGKTRMSWLGDLFKLAKAAPEGFDPETMFAGAPPATFAAPPTAVLTAPAASVVDTEKDTLRAELARERSKNIALAAATFADKIIEVKHKAFPAEREAIVTAYTQAAADDVAYPGTVTFANGTQGSRVAVLEATYEARPAHQLTMEQLGPELHAIFNKTATENPNDPNRKPTREELDAYLGMTALGTQALKARNGAN